MSHVTQTFLAHVADQCTRQISAPAKRDGVTSFPDVSCVRERHSLAFHRHAFRSDACRPGESGLDWFWSVRCRVAEGGHIPAQIDLGSRRTG